MKEEFDYSLLSNQIPQEEGVPSLTPIQQNRIGGGIADILYGTRDFLDKAKAPEKISFSPRFQFLEKKSQDRDVNIPLIGGMGAGELFIGDAPEEAENLSYSNFPFFMPATNRKAMGLPIRPIDYLPQLKPDRKQSFADLLFVGLDTLGLGAILKDLGVATGKKVIEQIPEATRKDIEEKALEVAVGIMKQGSQPIPMTGDPVTDAAIQVRETINNFLGMPSPTAPIKKDIFIGETAKNWDNNSVEVFEQAEKEILQQNPNISAYELNKRSWQRTAEKVKKGDLKYPTFRGFDGKLRQEIGDKDAVIMDQDFRVVKGSDARETTLFGSSKEGLTAKFKEVLESGGASLEDIRQFGMMMGSSPYLSRKMEHVLDHPEIYEAYGGLLPFVRQLMSDNFQGAFRGEGSFGDVIIMNPEQRDPTSPEPYGPFRYKAPSEGDRQAIAADKFKSTLLHEITHFIQSRENFNRGSGSGENSRQIILNNLESLDAQIKNKLDNVPAVSRSSKELFNEPINNIKIQDEIAQKERARKKAETAAEMFYLDETIKKLESGGRLQPKYFGQIYNLYENYFKAVNPRPGPSLGDETIRVDLSREIFRAISQFPKYKKIKGPMAKNTRNLDLRNEYYLDFLKYLKGALLREQNKLLPPIEPVKDYGQAYRLGTDPDFPNGIENLKEATNALRRLNNYFSKPEVRGFRELETRLDNVKEVADTIRAQKLDTFGDQQNFYYKTLGELEPRLVQVRRDLSATERLEEFPLDSGRKLSAKDGSIYSDLEIDPEANIQKGYFPIFDKVLDPLSQYYELGDVTSFLKANLSPRSFEALSKLKTRGEPEKDLLEKPSTGTGSRQFGNIELESASPSYDFPEGNPKSYNNEHKYLDGIFYRGQKPNTFSLMEEGSGVSALGDGLYLTGDPRVADQFGKSIKAVKVDPSLKIADNRSPEIIKIRTDWYKKYAPDMLDNPKGNAGPKEYPGEDAPSFIRRSFGQHMREEVLKLGYDGLYDQDPFMGLVIYKPLADKVRAVGRIDGESLEALQKRADKKKPEKYVYPNQEVESALPPKPVEKDVFGFSSKLLEGTKNLKQKKGKASQMLAQITKMPGISPKEIKEVGLDKFLSGKGEGKVNLEEVEDFIRENQPLFNEEVARDELGGLDKIEMEFQSQGYLTREEGEKLFPVGSLDFGASKAARGELEKLVDSNTGFTIIGNENIGYKIFESEAEANSLQNAFATSGGRKKYDMRRDESGDLEEIYTLNEAQVRARALAESTGALGSEPYIDEVRWKSYTEPSGKNYQEIRLALDPGRMLFSEDIHFPNDMNNIFHARTTDREFDKYGIGELKPFGDRPKEKVLYVEELQSDWAQTGRREGFELSEAEKKPLIKDSMEKVAEMEKEILEVMKERPELDANPSTKLPVDTKSLNAYFNREAISSDFQRYTYNPKDIKPDTKVTLRELIENSIKTLKQSRTENPDGRTFIDDLGYGNLAANFTDIIRNLAHNLQEEFINNPDFAKSLNIPPELAEKRSPSDSNYETYPQLKVTNRFAPMGKALKKVEDLHEKVRKNYRKIKGGVSRAPFVTETDSWTQLAIKRLLSKAVEEGYDYLSFSPGGIQYDRWGEEGLIDYYDKIIPKNARKVIEKIDKDAIVTLDPDEFFPKLGVASNDRLARFSQKRFAIKITPKLKEKILKEGLPLYKKGGEVSKDTAKILELMKR